MDGLGRRLARGEEAAFLALPLYFCLSMLPLPQERLRVAIAAERSNRSSQIPPQQMGSGTVILLFLGGGALNRLTRAIRPFRVKALRFGKMLSARSRQTQKTPIAQPAFHH